MAGKQKGCFPCRALDAAWKSPEAATGPLQMTFLHGQLASRSSLLSGVGVKGGRGRVSGRDKSKKKEGGG